MLELILKGFLIGFLAAVPVGPIGILCISRSLTSGFRMGLMTGFGAAMADGFFSLLACFGFSAVMALLMNHQLWIERLGGIALISLGSLLIMAKSKTEAHADQTLRSTHAFTTGFLLTLTNPITIFAFIAIFATVGLNQLQPTEISLLVAAVSLGSACWWSLLSGTVAFILHHKLTPKTSQWITRISGMVFVGLGGVVLLSTLRL